MLAYAGSVSCLREERQLRNAIIMGFPTSIEQSISEFSRFYHIHRLWYLCDTYSNVFPISLELSGGAQLLNTNPRCTRTLCRPSPSLWTKAFRQKRSRHRPGILFIRSACFLVISRDFNRLSPKLSCFNFSSSTVFLQLPLTEVVEILILEPLAINTCVVLLSRLSFLETETGKNYHNVWFCLGVTSLHPLLKMGYIHFSHWQKVFVHTINLHNLM